MTRFNDDPPVASTPFPWAIVLASIALIIAGIIGFMVMREHRQLRANLAQQQLEHLAWRDSITTVFEQQANATKASYAMTIDSLRAEVQRVRSTASAAYVLADGITADVGELEQSVQDKFESLEEAQTSQQTELAATKQSLNTLTVSVDSLGLAQIDASTRLSGGLDQLRSDLARRSTGKLTFGNAVRDALTITTVAILTTHIVGHPR